jgi:hypothetical protein
MEEYIKKTEIIKKLEKDIDSLRGYSEEEFPISFGMRLGLDGFKNYVKNMNKTVPLTNYDRIKSMNVDELTSVILMLSERVKKYPDARITLVKQWLLQEVSENDTKRKES